MSHPGTSDGAAGLSLPVHSTGEGLRGTQAQREAGGKTRGEAGGAAVDVEARIQLGEIGEA